MYIGVTRAAYGCPLTVGARFERTANSMKVPRFCMTPLTICSSLIFDSGELTSIDNSIAQATKIFKQILFFFFFFLLPSFSLFTHYPTWELPPCLSSSVLISSFKAFITSFGLTWVATSLSTQSAIASICPSTYKVALVLSSSVSRVTVANSIVESASSGIASSPQQGQTWVA